MRASVILFVSLGLLACSCGSDKSSSTSGDSPAPAQTGSGGSAVRKQQLPPPVDLKAPPGDATKTASGLIYKKLVTNPSGAAIKRNDTVMVNYTGWRQESGETFFTNQGRGQPMPLNLSQSAPGFTEALQQLRGGEKAVLWMPPEIGYKSPPADGKRETLVYLLEVVEVQPAPAIPDDAGKPPANATALKFGIKASVIRPGTGKDAIRQFDTVMYNYTVWDPEGKMLDSTEIKKHPSSSQPYRGAPAMAEMLMSMKVGERTRFWVDAEKVVNQGNRPPGGVDKGMVCYEIELTQVTKLAHDPPPVPPDVAKPPGDAKKTAKGTFYKLLAAGPGKDPRHPTETETVKVIYTGWTTDGRMFDSSYLRPEPSAQFNLKSVVAGWTDGLQLMTAGDRMRFWIPQELAYKGQPGKPAGMLVFDVELVEIVAPSSH